MKALRTWIPSRLTGLRRIYIIEGIISIVYGIVCYWLVPASFETAWFFNKNDKTVMRRRAELTQQYSGGTGHFGFKHIWWAAKDPKTWLHGMIQFCVITPLYGESLWNTSTTNYTDSFTGFNNFLPIIIEEGLGYSTIAAQYLTIPTQMFGTIVYIFIAYLSDRYRKRYLFVIIFTPVVALGYLLLLCPIPAGVHYFATFLITGGVYIITGNNLAWASSNSAPDGKRGATVGIVLTWTDCAGMIFPSTLCI